MQLPTEVLPQSENVKQIEQHAVEAREDGSILERLEDKGKPSGQGNLRRRRRLAPPRTERADDDDHCGRRDLVCGIQILDYSIGAGLIQFGSPRDYIHNSVELTSIQTILKSSIAEIFDDSRCLVLPLFRRSFGGWFALLVSLRWDILCTA